MDTRLKIALGVAVIALFAAGLWFGGLLKVGVGPAQTPSLERELVFPDTFPAEARPILAQNVEALRGQLQKDPEDISAWLDLAIKYKTVGDLDGAIEIWQYLADAKQNPVAQYNLGSTYHLELKKYPESERYFRKAIEANPQLAFNYVGLHELYRYSYKTDSSAAVDVLEEGLRSVSDNSLIDILLALGAYYKDKADIEKAIEYFARARDGARLAGNAQLTAEIQHEIDLLSLRR